MLFDIDHIANRFLDLSQKIFGDTVRIRPCLVVDQLLPQRIFKAHEAVCPTRRQYVSQEVRKRINGGSRDNICGRPLHHGDLLGLQSHVRHQRHGGGARADNNHSLSGVVEVVRPELGVDPLSLETIAALKVRLMSRVVVVIPGTHQQKVTGEVPCLLTGLNRQQPRGRLRRP